MRILDRYINSSIFKIFVTSIIVFCFMYVLIDITSNLDELIDQKTDTSIVAKYYLNFLPIIVVEIAPIACLIAALFTFSSMNNTNEIIVMRTSGMNFWQITRPALCFGLIMTACIFLINERLVPKATLVAKELKNEKMVKKEKKKARMQDPIEDLTFYGLKNRLYFIDEYNPSTYELSGVNIVEYDDSQNIRQKIVAYKGNWTGPLWKFYQVQVTEYDPNRINVPVKVKFYKEKLIDIDETPEDFLKQRLDVDAMNIHQLNDYIDRFANSGATKALNSLRVDVHKKIAYPFGVFVIILVGLPFALMVRGRKHSTFTSLGIAVAIGFLYYVTNAVSLAFGKGELLPPLLAAWAAPIIFTGVALVLIETKF